MSAKVSHSGNFAGRIYSSDDLHSAALVWIDRRRTIQKLVLKDHPHLSPIDLMGVVRSVELFATCNEELFKQLEAER